MKNIIGFLMGMLVVAVICQVSHGEMKKSEPSLMERYNVVEYNDGIYILEDK